MFKRIAQEPTIFLIRKMWRFAGARRSERGWAIAFIAIAHTLTLSEPAIVGWFLNTVQVSGVSPQTIPLLVGILALLFVVNVIFWVFHGTGRVMERRNGFYIRTQYREYLLKGVLALNASWHGSRDSGDTIDKVNKSSDALFSFSEDFFLVERIVLQIVGAIIALAFFNGYIALLALLCTAIAFWVMSFFDKRLVANTRALNAYDNRVSAKIFDALSNITSITILNVKEPVMEGISHAVHEPRPLFDKNAVVNEMKWFVGDTIYYAVKLISLGFFVIYGYYQGVGVEIGTVSALYLYVDRLTNAFFTFNDVYEGVILKKVNVQNVEDIEKDFVDEDVREPIIRDWKSLALRHMYFHYADTGKNTPHIDGVSLTLKRGERIALIGGSGSGKTTFLKVLHGMYPSAQGAIAIDDGHEKNTTFADVDLHTTLVPQEPEVFSSSIRENITLGTDASDAQIMRVAVLAEFDSVVEQLPKGLDSVINEKGVNLSGGQKQRLALARALLFAGEKDIILLDESTSSVDSRTEVAIYQNLFTQFNGRTILASIHKLNLLKYFDRIVIFECGRLVDEGTFEDLLERNAAFRENWEQYVTAHQNEF